MVVYFERKTLNLVWSLVLSYFANSQLLSQVNVGTNYWRHSWISSLLVHNNRHGWDNGGSGLNPAPTRLVKTSDTFQSISTQKFSIISTTENVIWLLVLAFGAIFRKVYQREKKLLVRILLNIRNHTPPKQLASFLSLCLQTTAPQLQRILQKHSRLPAYQKPKISISNSFLRNPNSCSRCPTANLTSYIKLFTSTKLLVSVLIYYERKVISTECWLLFSGDL